MGIFGHLVGYFSPAGEAFVGKVLLQLSGLASCQRRHVLRYLLHCGLFQVGKLPLQRRISMCEARCLARAHSHWKNMEKSYTELTFDDFKQ